MIEPTLIGSEAKSPARFVGYGASLHTSTPFLRRRQDRQFVAMVQAFRATGGVVCGDELACLLRRRSKQPISIVARWIVSRQVVSFEWQSQTMLPLFQFDPSDMALRPCVMEIVGELVDTYDDWGAAVWFASPNAWLDGAMPLKRVDTDTKEVLDAARADRFIARG